MYEHEYFDVTAIYEDIERNDNYDMGDILTRYEDYGFSHRWIQPPVACYWIVSQDSHGNTNMAPISMGTAMWGEPSDGIWYYCFDVQNRRQTRRNIMQTRECVISYYPKDLLKESWISALPIPYGISEIDVCKLETFPSVKVKAPSISRAASNVEVKILDTYPLSNSTLFIGRTVGCSVRKDLLEADRKIKDEPGLSGVDLLFEVSITGKTPRLTYDTLRQERIRTDDNIGDDKRWIGNFNTWMESEEKRGRISADEHERLRELNRLWITNPDPVANKEVKEELTSRLTDICWRMV